MMKESLDLNNYSISEEVPFTFSGKGKSEAIEEISITDYEMLKYESIQSLVDRASGDSILKAYRILEAIIGNRDDRKAMPPSVPDMKARILEARLDEKGLRRIRYALIPRVKSDYFHWSEIRGLMKDAGATIVELHAVTELTLYLENLVKEISVAAQREALHGTNTITAEVLEKVIHSKFPSWIVPPHKVYAEDSDDLADFDNESTPDDHETSMGKDIREEAARKRSRLLQIVSPETLPALSSQDKETVEGKLAAVPAAGNLGSGKNYKKGTRGIDSSDFIAIASAEEQKRFELEVKVDERLDKCLVCKHDLIGDVYICPACKAAKYHNSCVQALIQEGESCWNCKQPFLNTNSVVESSAVEEEIHAIDAMLAVLKSQYDTGEIYDETFKKRSEQLQRERNILEKRIGGQKSIPKVNNDSHQAHSSAPVNITDENITKNMPDRKWVKISYIIRQMNITDITETRYLQIKLKQLVNTGRIEREMQDGKSYYRKK
nr:hypothetical protein [Candidatus Sigynarchaeum springense]